MVGPGDSLRGVGHASEAWVGYGLVHVACHGEFAELHRAMGSGQSPVQAVQTASLALAGAPEPFWAS